MPFENLILGLELDPNLLGGNPTFRVFMHKDRNPLGGTTKRRLLEAPNDPMRIIHRRLVYFLRELNYPMPHATACRPRDSSLKNVQRHAKNRFLYLVDLRHAYRQVQPARLAKILCKVAPGLKGHQRDVQAFLEQYCVSKFGGLPMGAPASPDLFNLYCAVELDETIGAFCEQRGITYTRYLDDLTFSHPTETISRSTRLAIRTFVVQGGFEVNHLKAQVKDLVRGPVVINGIGLELGGRTFVPGFYAEYLSGILNLGLQGDYTLWPKIQGAMSPFLAIVNRRKPTRGEQRILRSYQRFRALVRRGTTYKPPALA